jgi:hypothetical protein
MSKQGRLILGCSVVGLFVTALIALFIDLSGRFDATLYTTFAVLCPPALICIPFSDVMKDMGGFYAIWFLVGLANAGLYAIIGAAIAGQLWKPD